MKGGLLLDNREGLLKGGDSGPALIPGEPNKSLMIKAVRYTDENLQMPPKGKKLSAEQVLALEEWIKMGAPDPRTGQTRSPSVPDPKAHWAFQPVKNPPVPVVKNKAWPKTSIDNFILVKLEEKKLTPSSPADKRTLIRRATFDLTGLPPTPEEVEAFEKDHSRDAFAKVVDRLLASPRYGERWARHWLDVARYADTKGYLAGNEERRYQFSYTYRDWVIRAFNDDLPYDQFIVQQIAADRLNLGEDKKPLAALGFLTLGRRFLNNVHDIIDDRIDVVCRGTMALTVGCARCHDHKYDPIPTRDYYSLYGVFASSQEPDEKPLLGTEPPKQAHEEYLKEKQRREDALKDYREQKITETLNTLRQKTGDYLLGALAIQKLTDKSKTDTVAREQKLDPGVVNRWIGALDKWKAETNLIFTPWFAFADLPESEFVTKAGELARKFAADKSLNPLVAKRFEGEPPKGIKDVAERYEKLFSEADKAWRDFIALRHKEAAAPLPTALPDPNQEALRQVLYAAGGPTTLTSDEAATLFDVPTIERVRELRRQIVELDAIHPGAPAKAMALVDRDSPVTPHVFLRGNPGNVGTEVPRQFLQVLAGDNRTAFTNGSGRLELALAIISKTNPLTARVMVNRVWLHHFGKGLVSTPSDFGVRSEPPSHPELLDWLAYRFMENGWSLKKLHREIMMSAVYQQGSIAESIPPVSKRSLTLAATRAQLSPAAAPASVDPENRLLWRMNRQRLEFESLRDSLLAASGKIDFIMDGLPVDIFAEPFSSRRSVYGYIDRQNLPGVLRTFDFANPDTTSPQRFSTTVPQQALFLLNSPFVVEQARNLVTNTIFTQVPNDRERVTFLYERLFQRHPEKEEMTLGLGFVKQQVELAPAPSNKSPWQYGYGKFDEKAKRVTRFTPFPHFTGRSWQSSPEFPDPTFAYAMLNVEGGHPGNHPEHAVIRRWTAPFDGIVRIEGELFHIMDKGDGVAGHVVSSRNGEVNRWVSFNQKTPTIVDKCEVQRGDTIDFVVDARSGPAHDTFKWAPVIKVVEVKYGTPPPAKMDWNATRDFDGPPKDMRPLTAWEKYAQTLLLSNEFVFVD